MELKNIFTKDVMKKELHYMEQLNLTSSNINMNANDSSIVFCTYEYYHMSDIITLYNCLSDFNLNYSANKKITRDYETIKKLVNFDRLTPFQIEGEYIKILKHYKYPSNHNISRIYPASNQDSSIVHLSRQLRYYLYKDFYVDIDLVNSHPTILYYYASRYNIDCPLLAQYVCHREEILSFLMTKENKDRASIKKKILVILNLDLLKNEKNPFFLGLSKEIIKIRDFIWKEFILQDPSMKDYLLNTLDFKNKSLTDQKITAQSVFCFTQESRQLKVLYNTLISCSKEFNTELSFIPFFDGAYTRFNNKEAHSKINEYIDQVNKYIFPFKFLSKPIEPNWSYLNENILNSYKNIRLLSTNDLISGKVEILLDYFNLPKNNFCEQGYKIIHSAKKEEISKLTNKTFNDYLEMKTRIFARDLNNCLLPHSSEYHTLYGYILNIISKNR